MRRIEDVFDVWFDSGSMPYAQVHYPFENRVWFDGDERLREEQTDGVSGAGGEVGVDAHNPADFIVEYIGQTRGWFYLLHVLATALFDRPAFKTVVSHGIVLGSDGQKMSKSLRNYPDVTEVFDRDGSDAMRWFLMASPILRGGNLVVTEQGIREGVRQVLLPFWNAYTFLALYAPKKGTWRTDSTNVLDRYVLAKLAALRDDLTDAMDVCDISGACDQLRQFTEALTNWYVRRSRSRFWAEDPDAIDTLHTVLEVTGRLAAPLLPLVAEVIWRGVTGERSVHLTDWPEPGVLPADPELVADMDQVRDVCSVGSSLRKAKKLRVRLPLPKLTVAVENPESLRPFADLIADELNVKTVELTDDIDAYGRFELTVNARAAGPRIGKDVQAAIKAVKAGEGVVNPDGTLTAGPATLLPEEYSSKLVAAEPDWTAALPDGAGLVVLDGTLTPELEAEGWAKDRIRELQELRKSTGLDVSDRISVVIDVPAERADWAQHPRRASSHARSWPPGSNSARCPRAPRSATVSGCRSRRRDSAVARLDGGQGMLSGPSTNDEGARRACGGRTHPAVTRAVRPPNSTVSPWCNWRPRRVSTSPLTLTCPPATAILASEPVSIRLASCRNCPSRIDASRIGTSRTGCAMRVRVSA